MATTTVFLASSNGASEIGRGTLPPLHRADSLGPASPTRGSPLRSHVGVLARTENVRSVGASRLRQAVASFALEFATMRLQPGIPAPPEPLLALSRLNATGPFNVWCGIEVVAAEPGAVVIAMPWRTDLAQYAGFLHAGLVGALIDTACGYAAATQAGPNLLASHFSVNCLRPATGERFEAHARVVKPGRSQFFTRCELFAFTNERRTLVATGETLLSVVTDAQIQAARRADGPERPFRADSV